ncbi:preprotein translocase subunit SecG [Candidatus Microgenomates bacterium]|nr:preprotein translocase subunit SecG [Candidatus Microgenomates bacterium]
MDKNFLSIFQIVLGIIVSFFILVQVKGTGFGRVWGGSGASFTRRGLEKLVFKLTFVLSFLFIVISILQLII